MSPTIPLSPGRSALRLPRFKIRSLDILPVQKEPLLPPPVTTPKSPMAPSKSKSILSPMYCSPANRALDF